jgi:hypothetical protein
LSSKHNDNYLLALTNFTAAGLERTPRLVRNERHEQGEGKQLSELIVANNEDD